MEAIPKSLFDEYKSSMRPPIRITTVKAACRQLCVSALRSADRQPDVQAISTERSPRICRIPVYANLHARRRVRASCRRSSALKALSATGTQRRTAGYIAQYLKEKKAEWEQDIFLQRRRLVKAEESLQKRETKKAREEIRIATNKLQTLLERLADLRRTQPNNEGARIFPMMHAPVLLREDNRIVIRPMRYACRLADKPADYDRRFPGTYNARRDSLDDYWREVYGRNHAVLVISGFYENVPLHLYEHRELAPHEQQRNLVLEFDPSPAQDMLVACLWDRWSNRNGPDLYSFAAITDEPTPEVAATGHQRTIITLQGRYLAEWLAPRGLGLERLEAILTNKQTPVYAHQIAA